MHSTGLEWPVSLLLRQVRLFRHAFLRFLLLDVFYKKVLKIAKTCFCIRERAEPIPQIQTLTLGKCGSGGELRPFSIVYLWTFSPLPLQWFWGGCGKIRFFTSYLFMKINPETEYYGSHTVRCQQWFWISHTWPLPCLQHGESLLCRQDLTVRSDPAGPYLC